MIFQRWIQSEVEGGAEGRGSTHSREKSRHAEEAQGFLDSLFEKIQWYPYYIVS